MRRFLLLAAALTLAEASTAQELVVRGERVYTMAGPPLDDGVVWVKDGKVHQVGKASEVALPAGVPVLTAKVVTPGLVDAHTVVGLSGYLNQPHDQDQLDPTDALQPELRAIDAYNAQDRLVSWVRSFGVTTLHTGHGPGAVISGQTMVVKTVDVWVDTAVIKPICMVAATLGEGAIDDEGKPGTRSKAVAMLRARLVAASDYKVKVEARDAEKPVTRDLGLEVLARVLGGEIPLLVTAHRAPDILAALRVAQEFDLKLVLDGGAESYLVTDELKQANIPVIVHPPMMRAFGEKENASMETASLLKKAAVPFALQSGFESYVPKTRVVLFEAAIAAANGLAFEEALAAITIDAASILGVADRLGSLAVGKDADIALFDGDPFEYATHAVAVVIDGNVASLQRR